MQTFRCINVDGVYWLQADMRLQCYTSEWAGYVRADIAAFCVAAIANLLCVYEDVDVGRFCVLMCVNR